MALTLPKNLFDIYRCFLDYELYKHSFFVDPCLLDLLYVSSVFCFFELEVGLDLEELLV